MLATRVEPKWTARPVYWSELRAFVETPVLEIGGAMNTRIDGQVEGPTLIEAPDTVIAIRPGMRARFDDAGNLVIELFSPADAAEGRA
jgi:N-methylhydantoinase A/oxoprolinase/acetone carboxylase beta subunit